MSNFDEHVKNIKAVRASLYANDDKLSDPSEEIMTALAVYESALKAQGVGEIKSVLGELAPLVVSFIDGLKEDVEQDRAAKKSAR